MTDRGLVEKRLALIETCVAELRRDANADVMAHDLRERRFVEHTLQIAIQAALDIASHIASDERLGEARTNAELFALLERHGWIGAALSDTLRRMAGFRNVLVHGYDDVDLGVVRDVLTNHLGDLLGYVDAVRRRLV